MNIPLPDLQLVDLSADKTSHKPVNPCGVRPYQHLVMGGLLGVLKQGEVAPLTFPLMHFLLFSSLFFSPFLTQPDPGAAADRAGAWESDANARSRRRLRD